MNSYIENIRLSIILGFGLAISEQKEYEFEKMMFEELVKIRKFMKDFGGNEDESQM